MNALSFIFSDETALFRTPSEPESGDTVALRIRAKADTVARAMLLLGTSAQTVLMRKVRTDAIFDWFEAEIVCWDAPVSYAFLLEYSGALYVFKKDGLSVYEPDSSEKDACLFRFTPGFHVPEWSKGAVQYQIFPDRFCNGNAENDVRDGEYYYVTGHSRHVADWERPPSALNNREFYGGDLQGIRSKLDYLQELGVQVLYLNPIFVSPSSHKYDTQDYDHIDPHFAVIVDDRDQTMQDWEKHNGFAQSYICRVTSPANLEASDAYFADFCTELHQRGMRIILDGVFNHCGSFNKWMDREGIYLYKPGYETGAFQDPNSPYRKYFRFKENTIPPEYEGWWEYITLPKLNYEDSPELCEAVYRIAEKWASPPYSIDGWRLDVAADLGHSLEFNHRFWQEFRRRVKAVNPNLLILAEHYGDPSDWLKGNEWDTVMNYDAFMEPVTYFLTGMDKHSDNRHNELRNDSKVFFETMFRQMAHFEAPSLYCAMNELSNHDHSRFLTRTNRTIGRAATLGTALAGEGINKAVFREAIVIQMTWPGAPTVYYADEAGQVGWTDPDNRRTYPWGHEDAALIELHRALIRFHRKHSCLTHGSVIPLVAEEGIIAYTRADAEETVIVAVNNTVECKSIDIPVAQAGLVDHTDMQLYLQSDRNGFIRYIEPPAFTVKDGMLSLSLPATAAVVLWH